MANRCLKDLIEELASTCMMAEASNHETVETLSALVDEIIEELSGDTNSGRREKLAECQSRLRSIDENEQGDEDLEWFCDVVTDLQRELKELPEPGDESSTPQGEGDHQTELKLPEWVEESTFREFLAGQELVLEELESDLLEVEKGDATAISRVRRRVHTLKGEAGALGLYDLETACHAVEDRLVEEGISENDVDDLLWFKDWLNTAMVTYASQRLPQPSGETVKKRLLEPIESAEEGFTEASSERYPEPPKEPDIGQEGEPEAQTQTEVKGDSEPGQGLAHVDRDEDTLALIGEFLQESSEGLDQIDPILMNIEQDGLEAEMLDALFRVFHTIKGVSGFLEFTEITTLAHTTETLLNQARSGTLSLEGAVLDLVFDATATMREYLTGVRHAVEDSSEVASAPGFQQLIAKLEHATEGEPPEKPRAPAVERRSMLGELLVTTGAATKETVDKGLERQKQSGRRLGEELVASGDVEPRVVSEALRAQRQADTIKTKLKETVKVDLERVDDLVEMIGELVIVESMVAAAPEIVALQSSRLRNYLGQLSKICRDLQRASMQLRMFPVRGVFQKMARMVRDLSKKSNKKIDFIQAGQSTEMDRSMVEQISDPLVHMIRNSVDHGIEPPEERLAAGKTASGTVWLSAYHEGGNIVIEICDNGRGLNRDAIVKKAIDQGLIKESDALSDNEIFNLIFAPGFSTAKQVTEISGRGVGMDVVKRNIEKMRGRVSISSEPGRGTTFKIILPLTLAIIDGMVIVCGNQRYIIPTLSIIESIRPTPAALIRYAGKKDLVNIRDEILPLIRLDRVFNIPGAEQDPTEALVVVVETTGQKLGILVDDVVTQQQVVIKSLDRSLGTGKYLAGATILSDGKVGLILNVDEISGLETDPVDEKPQAPPANNNTRESTSNQTTAAAQRSEA